MRYLLLVFLIFGSSQLTRASHLLGGEISYTCLGNGMFKFKVIVYRNCQSSTTFTNTIVNLTGPTGTIACSRIATFDMTPNCGSTPGNYGCAFPTSTSGKGRGSVGKIIFESAPVSLSSLGPAPLVDGYTWMTTNSIPCCRNYNNNTSICGAGTVELILRLKMHRFTDASGIALSPAQMCDNSPAFLDDPVLAAIANPNDTIVMNNFAPDLDRTDETIYRIGQAQYTNSGALCNYEPPFSLTNPIPGIIGDAIDSLSGMMRFNPSQQGAFLLVIKAESYRFGQLISEVYRDYELNVIANPPGSRPLFNPGTTITAQLYQQRAPVLSSSSPSRKITLYAGDTLIYPMLALDSYPLLDPPVGQDSTPIYNPDSVSIFVKSNQLGSNGNDVNTGCLFPPCAVIRQNGAANASPIRFSPVAELLGYGYIGQQAVAAELFWTPDCSSQRDTLSNSYVLPEKKYAFVIGAMDDACPLRGLNSQVLEVTVITSPEIAAPIFRQLSFDPAGKKVSISWTHFIDTSSIDPIDLANHPNLSPADLKQLSVQRRLNAAGDIEIERASFGGSFTTVAVINNRSILSWVDTTIVAGTTYFYRLASVNNCTGKRKYTEELRTVQFGFGHDWANGIAQLSWDSLQPTAFVPATFTGEVVVERENFTVQPTIWQVQATLNRLTSYNDAPQTRGDSLNFRVGFVDSSGLISYSRAFGSIFDLDALSVNSIEMAPFQLYPNPVDKQLYLKLPENTQGVIEVSIYDIRGRLAQNQQLRVANAPLILDEISTLVPGVYQLSLQLDGKHLGTQRFVKR